MNVLMTGATSFLGSNTAAELIRQGHRVTGLVRPGSRKESFLRQMCPAVRIIHEDLDRIPAEDMQTYLRENKAWQQETFDVCIHYSWDGPGSASRMDEGMQVRNIANAKKVFRLSEALGCRRFVFSGSQAEYGRGDARRPQPVSAYGKAKLTFGQWAEQQRFEGSRMDFIHARIFSVYGVGDHETSLVNTLIRTSIAGEVLALSECGQMWNYLEIRDCAAAMSLLVTDPDASSGIYDVAGETTKPLKEYVKTIDRVTGGKNCYVFGKRGDNAEGSADMRPDIHKLRKLGFKETVSFEEGIRHLYDAISSEPGVV